MCTRSPIIGGAYRHCDGASARIAWSLLSLATTNNSGSSGQLTISGLSGKEFHWVCSSRVTHAHNLFDRLKVMRKEPGPVAAGSIPMLGQNCHYRRRALASRTCSSTSQLYFGSHRNGVDDYQRSMLLSTSHS